MQSLSRKHTWISYVIIGVFLLWVLFPILLMFLQAIKPDLIMFSDPPKFFFKPTLDHARKIFGRNNIMTNMSNSVIVAMITMVLSLVFGSMCAYVIGRVKFTGKALVASFIILTRMVPVGALMMPIYVIMHRLGLTGSYAAVIFAHTTLNLPFAVLLLLGFFREIPLEMEQAAQVDGCGHFRIFTQIAIPLIAPGLATTGIMVLLNSWNEFMFALILSGRTTRTLPIGISSFMGSVSIDWGASSAAASLATIPVFIFGICIQKYFIRGITSGSVKG